jgi:hypothetical protein
VVEGGPGDTNFGNIVPCRYLAHATAVCRVIEQTAEGWVPSVSTPYCDWPFIEPQRQCGNVTTPAGNGTTDNQSPLMRLQLRVKSDPYIAISEATQGTARFHQNGSSFSTAFALVILVTGIAFLVVGVATVITWLARRRRRCEHEVTSGGVVMRTTAVPPRFQRNSIREVPSTELGLPEIRVSAGTSSEPFSDTDVNAMVTQLATTEGV